jgi:peroxiredoxin
MKKFFLGILVSLLFLFSSLPVLSAKDTLLAPDFTLQDTQGNKIKLADYRDKQPILLFFWTTWCPFCREELKALNLRHSDLTKTGWKIMVIDVGEGASQVNNFTKKNPLVFNVLLDTDSTVSYIYDVLGVPTYVLIDKGGRIAFQGNVFPADYENLLSK